MGMFILSIETSCDETALALLDCSGTSKSPKIKVLENLVSSQIDIHRPFGGVVPNLAKREHEKNLPLLYSQIKNSKHWKTPDLIAITSGPGLPPALWVGIGFAKKIGEELDVPVVGANHMEGHLYSFLLEREENPQNLKLEFPGIALVVSGGHTMLLLMKSLTSWKNLGETRDDAVGEAFDKIARLMNLPYPGGPEIEKLAKEGNPKAITFPRPMIYDKNPKTKGNSYEFSFSGLKTSVLYYLKNLFPNEESFQNFRNSSHNIESRKNSPISDQQIKDISASAQQAILDVLSKKTMNAVLEFGAKSVILCGGVAANQTLRRRLSEDCEKLGAKFFSPEFEFNTDNAAMIGAAAYIRKISKKKPYPLVADSNLTL
ncbi:MAG: tRNA (adenosine(37)-N6)-threonylcarbamoyltransferase complex transferase subunit TsaD [Candidatus Pacebacteria bacterium]|nr:tRNA (adenosine(37)-N6)-threonylcarbamoyltransferase complex transferase subunit TsaD [Candidatus Paceibacterota bacterium]